MTPRLRQEFFERLDDLGFPDRSHPDAAEIIRMALVNEAVVIIYDNKPVKEIGAVSQYWAWQDILRRIGVLSL